ncbi:WD40 repeat-containing protein [Tieghemostelium lacteum]|uniref:WD40 repeat-containing protein n=1 Tax=Tieghemostelium lacteum TaxID=361077 RepID=A0A152A8X5_TIELA|nr:WD40 repeat-containing protein [Tieghemostelium lacteum]|eukprot:KYR02670.1 WD40 repeat-containing protein [Tieghemostelium lacteum]
MKNQSLVHKCSFLSYKPSEIISIASNDNINLVAVACTDSTISLYTSCNSNGKLSLIATIGGSKFQSKIIGIQWLINSKKQNILLSVTEDKIYQWDIQSLSIVQTLNTMNASVVGMSFNQKNNQLVTCSLDSHIHIYKYSHDLFEYTKSFPRSSQASSPTTVEFSSFDNETILVGTNKELLVLDTNTMTTKSNIPNINITALRILDTTTAALGTIKGEILIVEYKFGSILQSFKHHIAPVRSIVLFEETTIFASGDDPTMLSLSYSAKKWNLNGVHRHETHDIRSLAISNKFIVSGGVSTKLITQNAPSFASLKDTKFNTTFQHALNNVAISSQSPILLIESHKTSLHLWSLGTANYHPSKTVPPNGTNLSLNQIPQKLIQLESKFSEFIECVDISKNGQYFAYSTRSKIQFYHLDIDNIKIKKITLPFEEHSIPISFIKFTNDSKYLVMGSNSNTIYLYDIESQNNIEISKPVSLDTQLLNNRVLSIETNNQNIAAIYDSSIGSISIFNLNEQKFKYMLPKLDDRILKITFIDANSSILNIVTENQLIAYNVDELKTIYSVALPSNEPVVQLTKNPNNDNELMIWYPNVTFKANLNVNPSKPKNIFTRIEALSSVNYVATTDDNEMVVSQLDFIDKVLPTLPPAIKYVKRYGQ